MPKHLDKNAQVIRVSITDDVYWLLVQEGAVDHLSATRKAAEIIREWASLKRQQESNTRLLNDRLAPLGVLVKGVPEDDDNQEGEQR